MKKGQCFFATVMLLIVLFVFDSCTNGGKRVIPKKIYSIINIPDGEFLHYGTYSGGDKILDQYFVTKKETNSNGGINYRIYCNFISVSDNKKHPEYFTNWPMVMVIDTASASVVESEGKLSTNTLQLEAFEKAGIRGLIYWHYQLYRDKGYVDYTSKSIKGEETVTQRFKIYVKTGFPLFDAFSINIFANRLIDPAGPGIMYWIIPSFFKEPLPISTRIVKKETITTKAGTFNVNKINTIVGDEFLNALVGPILKNTSHMVEDSDRRLIIKREVPGGGTELEEISNVNLK